MTNIIALSKVLIKNNVFAFSGRKKRGKQVSTKGSIIGYILLVTFCVACLGGPVIFLLNGILKEYDLSELILSFVLPLGGLTSIIFGVFSIVSVFYFSKDSEQLLPLPIKSSELLISKFIASLITEYLILLMFIYPIIFGVGLGIGASFAYYLYSIIICLLMPIIPSVMMAIIVMLANKLFHFGKRKDIFMYVMTGLIILFSFAYSFGLEFILESEESGGILNLLGGDYLPYLKLSKWLFPFFNSASYSLIHANEFIGFASLMTFIGINIIFVVVLYFVGDSLYIKGLTSDSGNRQSKKKSLEKDYKTSKGGVMSELIKKEWLIIKRTPIFMLNTVLVSLIMPVILIISFMMGFNGQGSSINLAEYIDFSNGGILFIVVGVLMFISSMSTASSSAISREGNTAWMMKTIPVSLKKQLDAKVYFSLLIDLIILILMEVSIMLFIRVPVYYVAIVNIPLILVLLIVNYVAILIDLRKPRLDWVEESEAVKQNFNVFITMILTMIVAAIFVVLGVYLFNKNVNIFLMFAIMSVLLLAVYVGLMIFISKNQNKLFNKVG